MQTSNDRWKSYGAGLVFLLALSLGVPASAQERTPKVAVLEVKAVGTFPREEVAGLSAFIATEVSRFRVQAIAAADLAALIDLDRQKALLGCSDTSCLAEIGGALGVDHLVSSEVSRVGGLWLVTVALLDVAKSRSVGRVTQRSESADDLVPTTAAAIDLLMRDKFALEAKREGVSTRNVVGYALNGLGAALLVSGAVVGVLGRDAFKEAESLAATADPVRRADFHAARSSAESRLLVADVLLAGGLVAGATGLYLTFTSPDASSSVTLGASTSGAGPGLALWGEF